jgi:AraC-like DNA-binding protein
MVSEASRNLMVFQRHRLAGRTMNDFPCEDTCRRLGGYIVYLSGESPFSLEVDGRWRSLRGLAVVAPYTRHILRRCQGLKSLLIESESVSPKFMADERWHEGGAGHAAWAARIDEGFAHEFGNDPSSSLQDAFDRLFFGQVLPRRELDPRIARVAQQVTEQPDEAAAPTNVLAASVALSCSRLSHLFYEQVGVSLRTFRAWKRLRNLIPIAVSEPNLLNVAMAAGYADATHLSHTMRSYLGRAPRRICDHWRRYVVLPER